MRKKLEPKSMIQVAAELQNAPARVRQHEEATRRQAVAIHNAAQIPALRDPSIPLPPPPAPPPPPPVMVPNNLQAQHARVQQPIHNALAAAANSFWRRS